MDLTIIEEIKARSEIKIIQRYCNKILKKLSFKSCNDLENVSDLMILLYIFDMYDEAKLVGDIVNEVTFNGDYDLWTQIRFIRYIKARILKELGEFEQIEQLLKDITSLLNPSLYENQAAFLDYYDENIEGLEKLGFKSAVRDWKLLKLKVMIMYYEIENFPLDKETLNNDIIALKEELKTICKKSR